MAMVVGSPLPSPRQARLRADPEISVAQLQQLVDKWLVSRGTRDILKVTQSAGPVSWSHAAKLPLLCEYSDLLFLTLDLTSTLKLCHKQVTKAVLSLHFASSGAILFGSASLSAELLAAQTSYRLRVMLSKFRDLRDDEKSYSRMLKEVDHVEIYIFTKTCVVLICCVYVCPGDFKVFPRRLLQIRRI